jgi:hypothetical protein
LPAVISRHASHTLQGVAVGPCSQFRAFASSRAVVVFPTPRAPVNKNACATRPLWSAFAKVRLTCSWPTISAKVCGRYLRARTVYDMACPESSLSRTESGKLTDAVCAVSRRARKKAGFQRDLAACERSQFACVDSAGVCPYSDRRARKARQARAVQPVRVSSPRLL